ncbi:radical SAM protein [Paraburkholderia bannensis]|uniref:radical SAM protein n=1 Tax=Paraburkholderia bannensis TaxID=765414 RepID=UPI002AB72024|nr:radical SAM protein [Paraburkholderia bannensis]
MRRPSARVRFGRLHIEIQRQNVKVRGGPDGLHLFDRSNGFNALLDEVQVPRDRWSKAPRQVSIALTNLCDLQCSYCYAPKHRSALDVDVVGSWLTELDSAGCLGVGFGGGEPTLHPAFAEICGAAARDTQLAITFTTHGHRLIPRLLDQLVGSVHFIRVSIDGVGRTYERLRGRPFQNLVTRLRDARQLAPIGINVVVNADTVDELNALVELAEEVKASELLLLPQQPTHAVNAIDAPVKRKLTSWLSAAKPGVRLAISEAGAQGIPTCDPLPKEKGLRSYVHIDASGYVRSNSYAKEGVAVGIEGVIPAIGRLRAAIGDNN